MIPRTYSSAVYSKEKSLEDFNGTFSPKTFMRASAILLHLVFKKIKKGRNFFLKYSKLPFSDKIKNFWVSKYKYTQP